MAEVAAGGEASVDPRKKRRDARSREEEADRILRAAAAAAAAAEVQAAGRADACTEETRKEEMALAVSQTRCL
jgi:hypothetical protein